MKNLIFVTLVLLTSCGDQSSQSNLKEVGNPPLRGPEARRIFATVTRAATALDSAIDATDRYNNKVVSQQLLQNTKCVVAVNYIKGGFLLGGSGGLGQMACRNGSGWSMPSFMRSASFELGATIGVKGYSVTLFITNPSVAQRYMGQLNIDLKAYAEAVAANAEAALRVAEKYGLVMVITNDAGLYAGVGISFTTVDHMPVRNAKVYGYKSVQEVLSTPAELAPELTKPFNDVLRRNF